MCLYGAHQVAEELNALFGIVNGDISSLGTLPQNPGMLRDPCLYLLGGDRGAGH